MTPLGTSCAVRRRLAAGAAALTAWVVAAAAVCGWAALAAAAEPNLIANGNFNGGLSGWTTTVVAPGWFAGYPKFFVNTEMFCLPSQTGNPYLALDVPGGADGYVETTVDLPAAPATLRLRTWGNLDPVTARVSVVDAAGTEHVLETFTPPRLQASPSSCTGLGPVVKSYPLDDHAGQSVRIRLRAWAAGANGTFVNFDDVTATAARPLVVNSKADGPDLAPGDGACDTGRKVSRKGKSEPECTLRGALEEANAHGGKDRISFDIPGRGVPKISLRNELPEATEAVVIDGATQPGVAKVELNGNRRTLTGLRLGGGGSTVRGLIVRDFSSAGLVLRGAGGHTVQGNTVGSGVYQQGAGLPGAVVIESPGNLVGGTSLEAANVVAGQPDFGGAGVVIAGAAALDNLVQGNVIGFDPASDPRLSGKPGETHDCRRLVFLCGVYVIDGASFNTIGGTGPEARNVISGNAYGVCIDHGEDNIVQGNYIGTDLTGASPGPVCNDRREGALGQGIGVEVRGGARNRIGGGPLPATAVVAAGQSPGPGVGPGLNPGEAPAGNLIAFNKSGVVIGEEAAPSHENSVQGNRIRGTDAFIQLAFGVWVLRGDGNLVGGEPADGNDIAKFTSGVRIEAGTRNAILSNTIHAFYLRAIDLPSVGSMPDDSLEGYGVTLNDLGDFDEGPNRLQNFPVLDWVFRAPDGSALIRGTLDAPPALVPRPFTIQFFAAGACLDDVIAFGPYPDWAEWGGGGRPVGSGLIDAAGVTTFEVTLPASAGVALGEAITATATDRDGNTSEYSPCVEVIPPPPA